MIAGLEEVARDQQARLMPVVDRLQQAGRIDYVRPVAIVNRLLIEGKAAAILELADSSEVSRIAPEWTSERRQSLEHIYARLGPR